MSFLRPFTFALFALFAVANHAFSDPLITSVGPTFGTPGTTLSIAGSDLLDATVHFGSTAAVPTNNTNTEITVDVPQLTPGTIPLFVTNSEGTSNSIPFTVQGLWTAIVTNSGQLPADAGSISAISIPATGFATSSTPIADLSTPTFNFPYGIAITPDGRTALAVNANGNSVSIIDIATQTVTGSVIVGQQPNFIAINSAGTIAYVTNRLDATITPIDLTTNPVIPMPPFPSGTGSPQPTGIAISFDDKNLYVINDVTLKLTPFDLTTDPFNPSMGTEANIPPGNPVNTFNYIALTPATAKVQKAFVSSQGSAGANSTVYSFTLDNHPQVPSAAVPIVITNKSLPAGMVISQDGTTLYVAGTDVSIIDVQHDAFVQTIVFPPVDMLSDVAITPDSKQLLVAKISPGEIKPVDLTTVPPAIQTAISSGGLNPLALAITPDQAPHAAFSADAVAFGTATSFDATLSVSPVGSIASYLWDFGDCTPPIVATTPFITHTYGTPGTFFATLTVTNTAGTSTTQVFPTGQTLSNNGNQNAFACHAVTVLPPPPAVTSMSPTQGPVTGGTLVTITGTGLNCVEEVLFGTIPGGITTIAPNGTSLTVLSPATLLPGGVTVTVQTCSGSAVAGIFIYFSVLPNVTGLSPNSGPEIGGTTVTITGTNLTCIQDVKFGGIPGGITSISPLGTSIIVTTPPASAAGPVEVTVETCDATLTAGVFTYFSTLPTVTSFAPISGPVSGGTSVVITGTNLTCVQDVKFGGIPGGITHISPQGTSITVTTPGASAPGPVEVTIEACSSTLSIGTFIYQQETTTLVCPPRDVHGVQQKTRHGLVNILTWKAPNKKCGEGLPTAYRIYRDRELTDLLGAVTADEGQVNFKFKDFDPKKGKKSYYIVSVDPFGNQSLPVMVTVRPKERHSSHSGYSH